MRFFNENVCIDVVFITEIIVVVVCGHRLYYVMDTLLSLIIYLFRGAGVSPVEGGWTTLLTDIFILCFS